MVRLPVMQSLLVALAAILLPACAGQRAQVTTSCGSVRVPPSENGGVVCVSLCDEDSAVNSCYGPRAPSERMNGLPVATGTGELLVAILNGPVKLSHLALSLRDATGWQVVIRELNDAASLREQRSWRGNWTNLDELVLRGDNGLRVRITADRAARVLYLDPAT
jgi:hypothetical protein